MRTKKAAMEMSVGTIVTIVLLMSVLVLGMVLVTNIFTSGKDVVDMTDKQLKDQINQLFSKEDKVVIYPETRHAEIKQGEVSGVGVGIRNKLTGTMGDSKFSYAISVSDSDLARKCGGIRATEVEQWMVTGREETNVPIPSGDFSTQKVLFDIPVGSPLCTIRFRVNVEAGTGTYATDYFDLTIKSA